MFPTIYNNLLWNTFLVRFLPGYNDDPENLAVLRKAILIIRPDRIQLNTLDRPGHVHNL